MEIFNPSQSIFPFSISPVTNAERFRDPRLHGSLGRSGCSPHGLVDSICPSAGVGLEFELLILSMKMRPGSPDFQAYSVIVSKTSRAETRPALCLVCGLYKSYSQLFFTASRNLSSTVTEILKFSMTPGRA